MKHNENARPDLSGDFPVVPRPLPPATAYPPREGCDGVPEERAKIPWGERFGEAAAVLGIVVALGILVGVWLTFGGGCR